MEGDAHNRVYKARSVNRCLVVEDDHFDRMMLRRCLGQDRPDLWIDDCETLEAARAYLLEAGLPDLIVLDNRLPDGRGADFAAELRRDIAMKDVMICVVTHDNTSSLDPLVPCLSKDDLNNRTLWEMVDEYLHLCAISDGSDTARAVQGFGEAVQTRLAPGMTRMLRVLRHARAKLGDTAPQSAQDELDKLEAMLLAMTEIVGEVGVAAETPRH